MSTLTVKGRRIYVTATTGSPLDGALRELGAKWDSQERALWVGTAKRARVEELLAAPAEELAAAASRHARRELERDQSAVIGSAVYRGQTYYVIRAGESARGAWVKLLFRDGAKSFFVDAKEVEIQKEYRRPVSFAQLRQFIEEQQIERDPTAAVVEECDECGAEYRTYGNVWDGGMSCRRCA